jgi:hypothetical protein
VSVRAQSLGLKDAAAGVTGGAIGGILIAAARNITSAPVKDVVLASIPMVSIGIAATIAYLTRLAAERVQLSERLKSFEDAKKQVDTLIASPHATSEQQAKLVKMLHMAEEKLAKELLNL